MNGHRIYVDKNHNLLERSYPLAIIQYSHCYDIIQSLAETLLYYFSDHQTFYMKNGIYALDCVCDETFLYI